MLTFPLALGIIVALLLLGMPIAFAFGLGALVYLLSTGADISFLIPYAFQTTTSFALLALPLFVLAGVVMAQAGISTHLLNFINAFVGRVKGGLGAVTVITCALFGAISGSSSAAIAAIGQIMIPRMVREGYPVGHATALVACSSVLALLIPPSVPMIVFAITGGLSVSAAFLSTVIPGVLLMIIYVGLNFFFLRNNPNIQVDEKLPVRQAGIKILKSGRSAIWALLMPIIILGTIYGGIATPTEAAAIAFVYATFAGFVLYRTLSVKAFWNGLIQATLTIGSIIAVLFFLFMMSRAMILQQVPSQVTGFLLGLSDNPLVILLLINLVLLLIGMIVDDISGSILAAVVLLPLATAIGVHPIHFAAIVGVNLGLGNVSPPCAPMLYMAAGVSKISLDKYFGITMKFLLFGHLPMVLIVTFIPELSLALPRFILGMT
ncbi:C4-dicarboxylate ABC transporter permease [Vreelandella aquamarina]|uniref:TRAP transporter large permease protein n=1 Tax=Vreelandella aquamarina TaxID=77097 RepID=A0A1N6DNK6_9GAMM|nr:TRAP transporter large permease [Halomonas meridiana]GED47344.1 C4-dicarboxylate ABC transporter permease [Halomonas meridiana]SIN63763.1 TRAP transporter, DctM subunit [Halomonas meridiana]SIN72365.1 TRAP transporter, DctM subunit [Halomonas meridiana]SIO42075.1 TRAP transporter, DctM subunit [Halomonas meridiana]